MAGYGLRAAVGRGRRVLDDDVWPDVERLLGSGQDDLGRMRADPACWADVAFVEERDDVGWRDRHQRRRARVLWALQYDRRQTDLSLLRFLLAQETAVCRSDPWSGMSEEAELAAFLVCEHRCPDDVWQLWDLKRANFDTSHEIDIEFLLSGGALATIDLVRRGAREDRDDLVDLLAGDNGEPAVGEAGIESWRRRMRARFPTDARTEPLQRWTDGGLLVGELGMARLLLDRWTVGNPVPELLSTRRWYLAEVFGEFAEAAAIQRQLMRGVHDSWDRASAQVTLARLERRAGRPDAAWLALRHGGPLPGELRRWRGVNLARFYVAELFLLVPLMPRGNRAGQVFQLAQRCARIVDGLTGAGATAAMAAAEYVGDHKRLHRYRRIYGS
jgi:hypothetical protein